MNPPLVLAVVDFLLLTGAVLLLSVGIALRSPVLKFWSAAYFVAAAGVSTFALTIKSVPWLGYGLGASLILLAYGLMWTGVRSMTPMKKQHYWVIPLGLLWALLCLLPLFAHGAIPRFSAFGFLAAGLMLAVAREALRVAVNPISKYAFAAIAILHATFYLTRSFCILAVPTAGMQVLWVRISGVEGIFFIFCDAFLVMNLVRSLREQDLSSAAHVDFLTGVLTRRRFVELAERLLNRADCALLILDVDHFKKLNDGFGHAEGDAVLRELGRICRENIRRSDLVGRLGGDEFAILLAESEEIGRAVAIRIQLIFAELCRERGWPTSVSIGSAVGAAGEALDSVLEAADAQLYQAKSQRPPG